MNKSENIAVMIAGIGGASLGTEIMKSLSFAGGYNIYGCDISQTAYGLYDKAFSKTILVSKDKYIQDILSFCGEYNVKYIVPGGEQPMKLLSKDAQVFSNAGIRLLINSSDVIETFTSKEKTFKYLADCHIDIPKTVAISCPDDISHVGLPCIVKPATDTGGSFSVFFAVSLDEAMVYADFIKRTGNTPIVQEYINDKEGEFTIGILSLPNGEIAGSVALKRSLNAKLSVAYKSRGGVISSGYSQGYIGEYASICKQAETIARVIDSRGPINIQGRIRDGTLLPFEINPRFSASTYLRTLAGFNEIDILIKHYINKANLLRPTFKYGWYLRSLAEQFIDDKDLKC